MNDETLKEYKGYLWKRWILDVLIRTVKTGAEAFLAYLTIGATLQEIEWLHALSVTAVAMLYTVLLNVYRIASDLTKADELQKLPFDQKGEDEE